MCLNAQKVMCFGFKRCADDCCTKVGPQLATSPAPSHPVQVLSLRQEKAKLLGFNSFAELSMSKKVGARENACISNCACCLTPACTHTYAHTHTHTHAHRHTHVHTHTHTRTPQMASLDRAEALLEELRASSMPAAQKDLEEVTAFAKSQVRCCVRATCRSRARSSVGVPCLAHACNPFFGAHVLATCCPVGSGGGPTSMGA